MIKMDKIKMIATKTKAQARLDTKRMKRAFEVKKYNSLIYVDG